MTDEPVTATAAPHEHEWHPTAFASLEQCPCGVMQANGQLFYPAWEWVSTPEGTVELEHPVGEAVRKHIEESKVAGPYDDVIGTDTTPTTITLTLPAREVAFMQSRIAGYGSGVDYLGEYEEAATDAEGIAQRIVRDTIGEWVVNEWRAKHPDADDKPNEGMG